jgi:phosphoribosylformylglycinamidine cyclo-ligase
MQRHGPIGDVEAYGNFNMGAGFAIYVPEADKGKVFSAAINHDLHVFHVGYIEKSDEKKVIIEPKGLTYSGSELGVR